MGVGSIWNRCFQAYFHTWWKGRGSGLPHPTQPLLPAFCLERRTNKCWNWIRSHPPPLPLPNPEESCESCRTCPNTHIEHSPDALLCGFVGGFIGIVLGWRDVMYVFGQTLTPDSKTRVLGVATTFGDDWLECETRGKREHEIALLPTGSQIVPTTETLCQMYF